MDPAASDIANLNIMVQQQVFDRQHMATLKQAIERLHANTHLPQLLGAMARFEATGDVALRGAAEAFWAELSSGHQFVTGGSTASETWKPSQTLGDYVSKHGQTSFGAHDVHETCVSARPANLSAAAS